VRRARSTDPAACEADLEERYDWSEMPAAIRWTSACLST
jgi:hypothetical protein